MANKIKRVFKSYNLWEETHHGMWCRPVGEERQEWIARCKDFMEDTNAFCLAMYRAIEEWPNSCEVNLTTSSMNRQAWLGHAACCIAIGCPEECTRQAWWKLTDKERIDADFAAAQVISEWEQRYTEQRIKYA